MCIRKKIRNAALFLLTASVVIGYQAMVFAGIPGEDIVLALRARQVIVGFEDGTMRWEEGLTRAQAAKIMATAMGLYEQIEKSLSLQDMFPDVPRAHWAFATVNLAGELGLVKGFPDGTFKPDRKVTKAEYAVMLSRMYSALGGFPAGGTQVPAFEPMWAVEEISQCADLVSALSLKPGDSLDYEIPRAEAANFTYTLMDRFGLLFDIEGTVLDASSGKITVRPYGSVENVAIKTTGQTKYIQDGNPVPQPESFLGKEVRIMLGRDRAVPLYLLGKVSIHMK